VLIHGGFWRSVYGIDEARPLAIDLAARGRVVWNIEYRRVGTGGGWPNTLDDVAAAIDHLAELDVDTSSVTVIGHSAGGHLAVWAASRCTLPDGVPGGSPRVQVTAAISQGAVLDLQAAVAAGVGGTATIDLLGGTPADVPERYAVADPMALLPSSVPVLCLHSREDVQVPFAQSEAYVTAAQACGSDVTLVEVHGDHRSHKVVGSEAWSRVIERIDTLGW
jgi:acetyl esterase/lipase